MKRKMPHLDVKKLKVGVNVLTKGVYVYKKLRNAICQMYLPEGTKVVRTVGSEATTKYRADKAIIVMIVPFTSEGWGHRTFKKYSSLRNKSAFNLNPGHGQDRIYKLGKTIMPSYWLNENPNNDCASGIYFWETLQKAEQY